ncbi:hypothetical protein [Roseiconus lacunae]|uniref:hypothetical protein n=1 Tax=Roseiconus lacunae TaxID=2605694 RepID=UPI001E3CD4AA|nr:hypothetical protein [Roseiconus lacunae]MCD0457924.1 hypothetical protein [Roseiconus lacunae]
MTDADCSAIIDEFDRHVRNNFVYLETEYGVTACPQRTHDLNEPRDAGVSIRYRADVVSVQIGISLIGAGISVTFKNENWIDTPRIQRVKWVSLDSVIAFKTNGEAKTLLHELTSSRRKFWPDGFLFQNMELTIQTLASKVQQHAADIIGGDVSYFPDIAANDPKRRRNRTNG